MSSAAEDFAAKLLRKGMHGFGPCHGPDGVHFVKAERDPSGNVWYHFTGKTVEGRGLPRDS